jgi:CMP/dCMP kinase
VTGHEPRNRGGLVVALDGPGSSGKSSAGAAAALQLGYRFADTGLLYRAVTWLALERGLSLADEAGLVSLAEAIELAPDLQGRLDQIRANGRDVTELVHGSTIDRRVSEVASQPAVRSALVPRQRALVAGGQIILAGRDIGTVILPDADLKIYLDASVEERARRRAEERGLRHGSPESIAILEELRRRDAVDSGRSAGPLRVPPDATIIRTDGNTFEETVAAVVAAIRRKETS